MLTVLTADIASLSPPAHCKYFVSLAPVLRVRTLGWLHRLLLAARRDTVAADGLLRWYFRSTFPVLTLLAIQEAHWNSCRNTLVCWELHRLVLWIFLLLFLIVFLFSSTDAAPGDWTSDEGHPVGSRVRVSRLLVLCLYLNLNPSHFSCMHTLGYVHRDLKSQNILMNLSGHVTVADLGMLSLLHVCDEWCLISSGRPGIAERLGGDPNEPDSSCRLMVPAPCFVSV
jgi:hypothetical protein